VSEVEVFMAHYWYVVIRDHDIPKPRDPRFVLPGVFCYRLRVGMQLRFKGPNWDGMASFQCKDGREVYLPKDVAFRVVGR
jgi:hypothetical protein